MMARMVLWTIQHVAAWERLQRNGLLRADGRRIWPHFRDSYRWMAEQMRLRLSPPGGGFPLWGWYRCEGIRRERPDLRAAGYLRTGTPGVRIEFELPDSMVLLSDFEAWHCVLNRSLLSLTEHEFETFHAELDSTGVDGRWPYAEPFRSRVVSSWQRIFDLEGGDPEWRGPPSGRSIQATFWELRLPQVRRVDFFRAR
jgi:hypothetical protein